MTLPGSTPAASRSSSSKRFAPTSSPRGASRELVKVVDEEMDGIAQDQRKRLRDH